MPWLYYLLLLALTAGVVLALQMPQLYVDKRPVPLRLISAAIGVLVALLGLAMADLKGDKLIGLIVAPDLRISIATRIWNAKCKYSI